MRIGKLYLLEIYVNQCFLQRFGGYFSFLFILYKKVGEISTQPFSRGVQKMPFFMLKTKKTPA